MASEDNSDYEFIDDDAHQLVDGLSPTDDSLVHENLMRYLKDYMARHWRFRTPTSIN
jgi:hypothetical protein